MRVGLTGGIARGKSTVSRMLRNRGAAIVDADQVAREVVGPIRRDGVGSGSVLAIKSCFPTVSSTGRPFGTWFSAMLGPAGI